MKHTPHTQSVFQRLREQRKQGRCFEPTPVPASTLELPRTPSAKLGVYASPIEFADCAGVSLDEITRMIERSELTHLRLGLDGIKINVRKGLADLERQEQGPGRNVMHAA